MNDEHDSEPALSSIEFGAVLCLDSKTTLQVEMLPR